MAIQDRFDLLITARDTRDRDELLTLLDVADKLIDEDEFHRLVEEARAGNEDAVLEGKHIRKRIKNDEVRVADGERAAKMQQEGIRPTGPVPTTGVAAFGKGGLQNVVIDSLLDQLEKRGYHLFGFRLEIKSQRNTSGEAKDARRQGREDAEPGGFKKTERGGQALMYGFRFLFFRNSTVRQSELYAHLKELAKSKIFAYGHAFENDDSDAVTLVYKFVPSDLPTVTRILRDEKGFYAKTIPNNEFGIAQSIERSPRPPSLMASLMERVNADNKKTG